MFAPAVIVVLGAGGMTGQALRRRFPDAAHFVSRADVDLRDCRATTAVLKALHATHVINLAAVVGGIEFNMTNQVATLEDNLLLACSVVRAAHDAGVQTMVSVLSTCIFPVKHERAFDETAVFDGAPHETNAGYAYAKRALLSLCQAYGAEHGRQYVCLVPPNLYGPHDKFDGRAHVVGALIRKFYEAEQGSHKLVRVYGSGAAFRQFMYADDLADLLMWAVQGGYTNTARPLIVADDGETSIAVLVATLQPCFSDDICVEWDATKPDGQLHKFAMNTAMRRLLPSYKFTPLKEGLAQTVTWYRSERERQAECFHAK